MTVIYVNIHIPKNAGQTFNSILKRQFGKHFARVPEARPGHIMSLAEKTDWLAANRQARCLSGHAFRHPAPAMPGVQFRYLTFLRHPIERLVSLFAYERQLEAANEAHSSHRPIEEWIEARLQDDNALRNFQTYHLLGSPAENELDLKQALRLVDSFFFVGIVERFDESLLWLARRMRRPYYSFYYRKINVTRSAERFKVTPGVQQRLSDLNSLDLRLYEYACGRLEQHLASLPAGVLAMQSQELERLNQDGGVALPAWQRLSRRLRLFFVR